MGHSLLRASDLRSDKMAKFDGKYVRESAENVGPCMEAFGIPEDMVAKMVDPKNEVSVTVIENPDGSFSYTSKYSLSPEWNFSSSYKIGETNKIDKPWPLEQTVTKNNPYTWIARTVMGNKTMVSESVATSYGMTVKANVEGTALSCTQVFKRVQPNVSGFYVFDSEKGLATVMRVIVPGMDPAEFDKMKPNLAFGITEQPEGLKIDERIGFNKKVMSIKFDESYDYSDAAWKIDEKRVTTKLGPGCYKTVCKSKKGGNIWEFTLNFNDLGFSVDVKAGGLEATEFYKRIPDIEGTWRTVSHYGMENYLSAFGVPDAMKEEMIRSTATEYFTLERHCDGKVKVQTNSKFFPEEMMMKVGETYTIETALGTTTGVMTELHDTVLHVFKFGGNTVSMTEKYSGNFIVSETMVNGNKSATMKAIMVRD